MTPAEVLAAAADRLEKLAGEATPTPWQIYQDDSIVGGEDREFGVISDPGLLPDDAAYIAAMNPLVGKALAAALRQEAEALARSARTPGFGGVTLMPPHEGMLKIARLIVGDES